MNKLKQMWYVLFPKRVVPDEYIGWVGYRRLADSVDDLVPGKCWCCRNAVAYHTWHCDIDAGRDGRPCEWVPCYVRTEITREDFSAGDPYIPSSGWVGLPPVENRT